MITVALPFGYLWTKHAEELQKELEDADFGYTVAQARFPYPTDMWRWESVTPQGRQITVSIDKHGYFYQAVMLPPTSWHPLGVPNRYEWGSWSGDSGPRKITRREAFDSLLAALCTLAELERVEATAA